MIIGQDLSLFFKCCPADAQVVPLTPRFAPSNGALRGLKNYGSAPEHPWIQSNAYIFDVLRILFKHTINYPKVIINKKVLKYIGDSRG